MKLEQRKDNTYFDQSGKQILPGDLLKVFHFRSNGRNNYMFHVVVMEETGSFPVMALKAHYADKAHCRMYVVANNPHRAYLDAKIIGVKDWETKRLRIKVVDVVCTDGQECDFGQQHSALEVNLNSSCKIGHSHLDSSARF